MLSAVGRMTATRCFAWATFFVAFAGWGVDTAGVAAAAEYPGQLGRMFDFARAEVFEGNFDAATDQLKDIRDWIKEPHHRQELGNWMAVQSHAESFDAWIDAEKGNLVRAKQLFDRVLKSLKHQLLPATEAEVHILAGDFDYMQAFPTIKEAKLPEDMESVRARARQHLKSAENHYEKAAAVLLKGGGGDKWKRLAARCEHGLARCAMAMMGEAGGQAAIKRHLWEAEQKFRAADAFKEIIDPGAKFPKSLKRLKRDFDANKDLNPGAAQNLLSNYAMVITEWLRFRTDQAEFAVMLANGEGRDAALKAHAEAEMFFRKAKDLCSENLSPANPLRFRLDVSQALYYVRRVEECKKLAEATPPGPARDRIVALEKSFGHDAIFEVENAFAEMNKGDRLKKTHPLWFEALLVELTAHDAGYSIAGRDRATIIKEMQDWVARAKESSKPAG